MVRQRENDVWSSVSFAYIAVYNGVNFTASMIIVFNYYFVFLNHQRDTFKKVCNYKMCKLQNKAIKQLIKLN
jgi:hypothetical protein